MTLDLTADAVSLTRQLVDIESVSRNEEQIADQVEAALRTLGHLTVSRHGHTMVARTDLGRPERVVIAAAGTADLPVADECATVLEAFGLEPTRLTDVGVAGVHRLLGE